MTFDLDPASAAVFHSAPLFSAVIVLVENTVSVGGGEVATGRI